MFEKESDAGLQLVQLVRREGMGEEVYMDESVPAIVVPRENCRYVPSYPSQAAPQLKKPCCALENKL